MTTTNSDVDQVDLLIGGSHGPGGLQSPVIVVDGVLDIDADTQLDGPVYVVGGRVTVQGTVTGDVVQLAGSLHVVHSATIGGELRHIAGSLEIDAGARIADQSEFEPSEQTTGSGGVVVNAIVGVLLAAIGFLAVRRRPDAVSNVEGAALGHPLVAVTVGGLVSLTFLAVFVFMAFTLILLPIALLGIAVGVIAATFGLIGIGRGIGRRLPIDDAAIATGVGAISVMLSLEVVGFVPFVGDWIALAIVLIGIGGVVVTYFGVTRFEIQALPGLAPVQTGD